MYQDTIDLFAASAARKAQAISSNPLGFFLSCMMAGAYIGLGILTIFSIGQGVEAAYRPLVMGLTFAIALTLVVFAGAELFTGHTMIMALGLMRGSVGIGGVAKSWALTWVGNLVGAAGLAALFWLGGGGAILKQGADLAFTAAAAKMHAPPLALLARGILCNWLVCLALWMSARTKSDSAKCIIIFWCLFAFIVCGFEHSVANMTLFSLTLFASHPDTITVGGMFYNLLWVSLGNIIAGALFVAAGYGIANGKAEAEVRVAPLAMAAE